MNNNQAEKKAINEENIFNFFLVQKQANLQKICVSFGVKTQKERYKLLSALYCLCEKETLKYSPKSRIYYLMSYYKKIAGIKKCKLKTILTH